MSEKERLEYEARLAELNLRFRRYRRRSKIIWLCYNVAAVPLIYFLLMKANMPLGLTVLIISTLASFVLLFNSLKDCYRIEAEQVRLLMEQAPVERMRFRE